MKIYIRNLQGVYETCDVEDYSIKDTGLLTLHHEDGRRMVFSPGGYQDVTLPAPQADADGSLTLA